jgi:hypothetical protein
MIFKKINEIWQPFRHDIRHGPIKGHVVPNNGDARKRLEEVNDL